MKVKGNKRGRFAQLAGITGATLLLSGVFATFATAQVTGKCENCHTMHNSQDNTTQVQIGAGAGWNLADQLVGGSTHAERAQLLKSDCVGCHSATAGNSNTIITDGNGNKVPIVFNIGAYPASPLAGGNFALNTGNANIYGHNVAGISNPDSLTIPPGSQNSCGTGGCHTGLAEADAPFNYQGIYQGDLGGCKGCHNKVGHHNPNDLSYRFLGGHEDGTVAGVDYVAAGGIGNPWEDRNWEQTPTATAHNTYKNQTDPDVKDSMGAFCAGCHQDFHANGKGTDIFTGVDNGGDDNTDNAISAKSTLNPYADNGLSNPWLRHPTNVNIPFGANAGEYDAMNNIDYNPAVPVAQNPAGNRDKIDTGDQVMCLSCHRAHASEYPDALRFNYTKMNAHNAAAGDLGTGCFFCHTTKGN